MEDERKSRFISPDVRLGGRLENLDDNERHQHMAKKISVRKIGTRWQPVNAAGHVVRGSVYNADGTGYSTKEGAKDAADMLSHELARAATRSHARVARTATSAADAGFAIHTDHEDVIKDNAREHFGPDYGDAAERAKALKSGLVDAAGEITRHGWEVLNKDFRTLETNALTWLRKIYGRASDQGHDSSGDLIGSVSFNPRNATQAHNIVVGKNERVDFSDASYGDFARSGAWKGVSNFGQSVLGGHITFFDIQPPEAFETAEETADKAAARRRAARKR